MKETKKLIIIAMVLIISGLFAQQKNGLIEKRHMIDENGDQLVMRRIAGYPPEVLPKPNLNPPSKAAVYLDNIPGYNWSYGCTATATAMFVGYYDRFGADQ